MAITAILRVTNRSSSLVQLRNFDNEGTTAGDKGKIPAGAENHAFNGDAGAWIPWATNAQEWEGHRIGVVLVDGQGVPWKGTAIWQRGTKGGPDLVRCSEPSSWQDPGAPIGGIASVGGDRRLVIETDGALSLEVYTPSPPPPPTEGRTKIYFRQDDTDPFTFVGYPAVGHDVVVDRVVNTAKSTTGRGFQLDLGLADLAGNPLAGPTRVAPGEVHYGDFAGKPAKGLWTARPVNISLTLVPNPFGVDLYWRR